MLFLQSHIQTWVFWPSVFVLLHVQVTKFSYL